MFEWRSLGTLNDHAEAELSTRIGEPMLLTTASSRMLDFLISWVANVRMAMLEQLVVVGALDQATFDWCSRAEVPALLLATTHNGTSSSYLRINAWLFASMAIAKVSLLSSPRCAPVAMYSSLMSTLCGCNHHGTGAVRRSIGCSASSTSPL